MINVLPTMLTENLQALSREVFIFIVFGGWEHYDMYYFFSVKQRYVKDIFIDGFRRQEQEKYFLKAIKKVNL